MRAPLHMCITALLMSLAFSLGLYGQTGEEELVFHFRLKETTLDTAYLDNRASLARLRSHIASVEFIDSICVSVSSSPEGSFQFNARLAAERAA